MAGPALTRANLRDYARLLTLDTASSPGVSNDNFNLILREALFIVASEAEGDETLHTTVSGSLAAGSNSASVSFSTPSPVNALAVYLSGVKKLKKKTLTEILDLQHTDPNARGEPEFYAINAAGSRDTWTILFDVKADIAYTPILAYEREIGVWSGDSATCPLGDSAALTVARVAAFIAASGPLGRPVDRVELIGRFLPERLRGPAKVAHKSSTAGGATQARPT